MSQTFAAGDTAASCPSVKRGNPTIVFNVETQGNLVYLKAPVSVLGDSHRTWVRYAKGSEWAVPFITNKAGKDVFLSWEDDGECMVVALEG